MLVDILTDFMTKRQLSDRIARLYGELGTQDDFDYVRYAERIHDCSKILVLGECKKDEYRRLVRGSFCDVRHCPTCIARRSLLQAQRLYHAFPICTERYGNSRFLFLTLTFPNCEASSVAPHVSKLVGSFKKLLAYQAFKHTLLGSYRSIETTYNEQRDDYNLHMHAAVCVKPGYFSHYYVKHSDWLRLWKKAFGDNRINQVNVKAIKKEDYLEAAFELGKYFVKPTDIKNSEVLKVVHDAFHKRRLQGSTGLLKEALAEAKLLVKAEGHKNVCKVCESELEQIWYSYRQGQYERRFSGLLGKKKVG